jgi:hypothetical protein
VQRLGQNFLAEFPFRSEVEPGSSIYDLARVIFPDRFVMLKEHFRCVEPIIRFSMRFYNHELIPLMRPDQGEAGEIILEIGFEGGSWTIMGMRAKDGWRFRMKTNTVALCD